MRKILLIVMIGMAAIAVAAPPPGVLNGTVVNSQGAPVAGARVFWQSADGANPPHVLRTNPNGQFRVESVREGLYDVRAESAGTWSGWEHNVLVRKGQEANVTLHLKRSAPPAPIQKPKAQ